MLSESQIKTITTPVMEWGEKHIWNSDSLYQLALIAIALIAAHLIGRYLKPRIEEQIQKLKITFTARRILRSLLRLLNHALTLVILFLGTSMLSIEPLSIDTAFSTTIMKVLVAWIAIRLSLQFIDNKVVRNFFATTIWVIAALSIFGILEQTTQTLDALAFTIGEFRLSALAVIKSVLLLSALIYIASFLAQFVEKEVNKATSLTRSSKVLISKILRVLLITCAVLIGITSAGIDLSIFAVFGGAIGLGLGFGLQKGISNLFSGMLLLTDNSIKPGDVIELENGTFGWVNHMAARYTEIVTRDNKSFLIPNEDFITQRVTNWSHGSNLIRIEVTFGVSYKHNPHDIKELSEKAALDADNRVVKDPTPVCHLAEFGDSSLNFKLRFWITDAEKGVTNIRGAVMLALWDCFKENNIEIPYPHREIYMRET